MDLNLEHFFKSLTILNESASGKKPLNVITLFSGMGAPEIALENCGIPFKVILASEYDDKASQMYKDLHSKSLEGNDLINNKNYVKDVHQIAQRIQTGKLALPKADLLVAGFPCQSFSGAGLQMGFYSREVILLNYDKVNKTFTPSGNSIKLNYKLNLIQVKYRKTKQPAYYTTVEEGEERKFRIYKIGGFEPSEKRDKSKYNGQFCYISPSSDGNLAIDTLNVINSTKPTVCVLENVAKFGSAKYPENEKDIDITNVNGEINTDKTHWLRESVTLSANQATRTDTTGRVKYSTVNGESGSYLYNLIKTFDKMGYITFPYYLGSTTYGKAAIARPRIYIISIKKEAIPSNWGDISNIDTLIDNMDNTLGITDDMGKTSSLDDNAKQLLSNLVTGQTSNFKPYRSTDDIINILLNQAFSNLGVRGKRGFIANLKSGKIILEKVNQFKLITAINTIDPTDSSFVKPIIDSIFDFIEKTSPENLYSRLNPGTRKRIEQYCLEENTPIESIMPFFKKYFTKLAYIFFRNMPLSNRVRTVLKSITMDKDLTRVNSNSFYIIKALNGKIYLGKFGAQDFAKLMGMENQYKNLYDSAANIHKDKKNPSLAIDNSIINRVGNSMAVPVLENLFSKLYQANIFS